MKEALKNTWSELLEFVKAPTDTFDENQDSSHVAGQLFRLLLLELPIMFVLILLIGGLEEVGLVDMDSHKVEELFDSFSVPMLLIMAVILVPFLEELIFRSLITFRRCYPLHVLISIAVLMSSKPKEQVWEEWEKGWNRNFKIVIYASAVLFGLVHLSNFEVTTEILLAAPILIAPQIAIGFFLAFLRIRYGFIWCFFLHGLHNFFFIGLGLIFGQG